jgi:hypothetical protein
MTRGLHRLGAFLALALAGCSGSSSPAGFPAPTPTPTGAFVPVDESARGTTMLALGAVKTIDYYARFLRPGLFPTSAPVNPIPTCDPLTATATTVTSDVTGRNITIALAFYPAGDDDCSRSITSAIELYYANVAKPSAAAPQAGTGYSVRFSATGQPIEYDAVTLLQYAQTPLNVDAQLLRYDPSSVPAGFERPRPGKFPASFPLDFPAPEPPPRPIQPLPFSTDFYASVGGGNGSAKVASASSVTTNPSFLPTAGSGASQYIGTVDEAAIEVGPPDAGGASTYVAKHAGSAYSFNVAGPVAFVPPSYALGAGNTARAFAPSSSGYAAYNFGAGVSDAATFGLAGNIVTAEQTYTDLPNAVKVQSTFPERSFTYSVAATDLLRHAAATNPGPYPLAFYGTSQTYVYTFDGSAGAILDFTVIE